MGLSGFAAGCALGWVVRGSVVAGSALQGYKVRFI